MRKIILGLILALGLIVRLYHFSSYFHWSLDEEYWAYQAFNVARIYHFPLIGGNIGGTGLYTTPWFIYLSGVVSFFVNGNPLGLGLFAVLIGVAVIFAVYQLGKILFSSKIGLLSSLVYSLSSILVIYDRRFWNPMLLSLLTTLVLVSVFQISQNKKPKFWLILGFSLALGFSIHGLTIVLLLFSIIFLIKHLRPNRWLVLGLLIFILSFLPSFFFEIRHGFVQTRGLINGKSVGIKNFNFITTTTFFVKGLSSIYLYEGKSDLKYIYTNNCPSYPVITGSFFAIILFLGVLGFSIKKSITDIRFKYLLAIILLNAGILLIWQEYLSWYYLLPSTVPVILLSVSFLVFVSKRWQYFLPILLSLFALLNILRIGYLFHSYGYSGKIDTARRLILLADSKPFSLYVQNTDSCQNYGYRYLFSYLNRDPVASYLDYTLGWLYDFRIDKVKPKYQITTIDNKINIEAVK